VDFAFLSHTLRPLIFILSLVVGRQSGSVMKNYQLDVE